MAGDVGGAGRARAEPPDSRSTPRTCWPPGAISGSSCPTTTWSWPRPSAGAAGPDLYLGPLRAVRPRRVAVAGVADRPGQASVLLDALTSLPHGPWWPPLDELLDAARHFYAGGLAETQRAGGDG